MKWVKSKVLGQGSFGTVSLAVPVFPGDSQSPLPSKIAVKSANYENHLSLLEEGEILEYLGGCPHIVRCFGDDRSIEDGEKVYNLLLEYAPGGTLEDLITSKGTSFPEFDVSMYAFMLLSGLDHIHRKGGVHCDIKPSNILVFPCIKWIHVNRLKIADFGLAKKANSHADAEECGPYKVRGTPLYSSPESVFTGQKEWPSDIWSLGCVLIEIFTGKPAYSKDLDEEKQMEQIANEKELPEIPDYVSRKAKDFLRKCLIRNPRLRWNASSLLKHNFIVDNLKSLGEHRALLSREDEPTGCTTWWSGNSSFSPAPLQAPPTPVPHAAAGPSNPDNFFPFLPREILARGRISSEKSSCCTSRDSPARSVCTATGLPAPAFSPKDLLAMTRVSTCVSTSRDLNPPPRFLLPHQYYSRNRDAVGTESSG